VKDAVPFSILNVNDDEANRYAVSRLLSRQGFQVFEARNGEEALQSVERDAVELVLLDVELPDISGIEVCRRLKSNPRTSNIPVIHLSAVAVRSEDKVHGIESGADAYFTQPVAPAELLATVQSQIKMRRASEALRESEERFRLLIESVNDYAILTLSPAGEIATWNSGAERLLGYSAKEILGQPLSRFFPPNSHARELGSTRGLGSQTHAQEEGPVLRRNGSSFWAVSTITEVADERGALKGFTVVIRDVSELKDAENALKRARDEAESANRAKSAFLANMSHEIRTPLNAVLGYGELLRSPDLPEAQRLLCVDTIERNGQQLLRLIDDILDLSKVEADKVEIVNERLTLMDVLADLQATFVPLAERKGLQLTIAADASAPLAFVSDRVRLRQILVNVIGNSIKFTDHGRVTCQVHGEGNAAGEKYVLFTVTDTGLGIEVQDQAKLFQPFVQVGNSRVRKQGGSGLGLILSKRLAKKMGGDLALAESAPGRGSTFRLRLPAQTVPAAATLSHRSERSAAPPPPPVSGAPVKDLLAGLRVLVAEDTPDNQFLLNVILKSEGAEVQIVGNGREAVEHALSNKPDIVLMDVQMPIMDGLTATRELRRQGFRRPIFALTAYAMREDLEMCFEAGCDDYLSKPLDLAVLLDRLARLLPNAAGA
jgi:PAS domain S-box-containing protein